MVVDERLVTYINSLDRGNTAILDTIEKEALDSYVPIIRKEMQSFLKLLLAMQKPKRILEVGTAVGFSAILMADTILAPVRLQQSKIMKNVFQLHRKTLCEQEKKIRLRLSREMQQKY